jgi:hypothetical protein
MARAHPEQFLALSEELATVEVDAGEPTLAQAIRRARSRQRDLLAAAAELDTTKSRHGDPSLHCARFLALSVALFEAEQALATSCCAHLTLPADPGLHVVADLTTGWASCGCGERVSRPRPDDGSCNLCGEMPKPDVLYEVRLTAGPVRTFRADICQRCWDWVEPLYAEGASGL